MIHRIFAPVILRALLVALAMAASVPSASGAQQRDTTRADSASRPFVRGGIYDKPYLGTLRGRAAIGGYAEAHARWQEVDGLVDESTFLLQRFNLFASTRVSDFVRFGAELEFEEGGDEVKLEYAAIDLLIHPAFALRGGMLLSPLGRFNLSHDSPLNPFTDRPLVSTDLLGVALSEPGFGALGQFGVGRRTRVTYEAYLTNGFHDGLITDAVDGTRIAFGRGNIEDNNGSPATVARVTLSPTPDHELGVSVHRGAYNAFNLEGTAVDKRRNLTISVLDFETRLLGTTIAGELATATIDIPESLDGIYAGHQRGVYAEAVREFGRGLIGTIPSGVFALKARWDYVDFDTERRGSSAAQMTLGANYRPSAESVLKLDYVRGRGRDEFNNLARHAFMLFSIATYF